VPGVARRRREKGEISNSLEEQGP